MATAMLDSVGLLLIGHGSQLPYNKENLEKLAEILRKRSVFGEVATSFMCRDTPTIGEALDMLAQRKVSKIVLVPAFLAAGAHTTHDIPELIEVKEKELQLKEKGIDLLYGQPIGSDERLAKILEEKALNAMEKETVLDSVGLLLIGHGSTLPYNKENLEKLAKILRKRAVFGEVATSFMCIDKPTIAEALDTLVQRKVSKIVLVPNFLAAGVHTTHDIPELIEVKEKELQLKAQGIDLIYGKVIGSDERIAKILEEKALHALRIKIEQKL